MATPKLRRREAAADAEDHVGVAEEVVDRLRDRAAAGAERQRVRLGERALALEARRDRAPRAARPARGAAPTPARSARPGPRRSPAARRPRQRGSATGRGGSGPLRSRGAGRASNSGGGSGPEAAGGAAAEARAAGAGGAGRHGATGSGCPPDADTRNITSAHRAQTQPQAFITCSDRMRARVPSGTLEDAEPERRHPRAVDDRHVERGENGVARRLPTMEPSTTSRLNDMVPTRAW